MKKLREFLGSGERLHLLLSAFAVGVMLLTALLLPLAFRSAPEPDSAEPADRLSVEKRQLFADYWLLGAEDSGVQVSRTEVPEPKTEELCQTVMRTLAARCIDDRALDYTGPTGSEYTVLRDENGTQLRLCRMWLEARGDWQNWLDVCFDADSGEVYYLYLSRECLRNRTQYPSGSAISTSYIAAAMEEDKGWKLRMLSRGEDGDIALFTTDSGTACYQIDCRAYDALVDVKICCR